MFKVRHKAQYREAGMFFLGSFGFLHELLFVSVERPILISASLGLMGLPFVIRGENNIKKNGE